MTSAETLLFRVNGMPQGKARPRFNRRTGNTYTPPETRAYEQEIKAAALKACMLQGWLKTDAPLRVNVTAWLEVPKSYSKKNRALAFAGDVYPAKKPDLDNIAKAVLDGMNEIAYHDDKQVVECTLRKRFCREGDTPHLLVYIEPMPTFSELKAAAMSEAV